VPDPDPLDVLRDALGATPAPEARTPDCLDDDTVAALAAGTIDTAARVRALSHLATCPRCRHAVGSVARALADPAVSREIARADSAGGRRVWRIALSAAAAAILIAIGLPRWVSDGGHRAPPQPLGQVPTPVSPVGVVAEAPALRWAAVAGADRYRLTLFNAAGRVLYEAQTTDTTVTLPDSVDLIPGPTYLWLVEAQIALDRWSASDLVRFSITARSRP
jgi:hypothetical protein